MNLQLNRTTVVTVPERPVKILQFGEGNFLRGFVDWMIDILNEKTDFNGDVQMVQPIPKGMGEAINGQEGLYHVLLEGMDQGKNVQSTRLITSVKGVLNPYQDLEGFLRLSENPHLEFIVSNTTEAGIFFDRNDTAPSSLPNSFPGKLTLLLNHRFHYFKGNPPTPLTVLPCELIDRNGERLLDCILQYSEHWTLSEAFKKWISETVVFCNTLVDRIVPGFPKEFIHDIQNSIGYMDTLVVKAEPFHLWVIEGPAGVQERLPFDKAGLNVVFTDNLTPYRTRKVRILNGAHTIMVPVAYLNGFTEVREVMEDEKMGTFLKEIIFNEIIPTLDMPQTELEIYANTVLDRFRNPFIRHKLLDIALNSVSKFRVRVLPSILNYMELHKEVPKGLATAFAYLLVFHRNPQNMAIKDDSTTISFFKTVWKMDNVELAVHKILSNKALWGMDLAQKEPLSDFIKQRVKSLI
ncbi:tagaturonate reductase [Flavobacteriaceae bacterium GF1]